MSVTATLTVPANVPPPLGRLAFAAWRVLSLSAAIAVGTALAWQGGPWAVAGCLLATASVAFTLLRVRSARAQACAPAAAAPGERSRLHAGRIGADVMVEHVVPVWSRQMESARDVAAQGLENLVGAFSQISSALGDLATQTQAAAVTVEPGAMDAAAQHEAPALAELCRASQRAFDERDRMVAELGRCAESLTELSQLAKGAREIARHTRLVAFNASIEAHRGRQGSEAGGGQAVAVEVRSLAGRMADIGEKIERQVRQLQATIDASRREGEIGDTTSAELQLEIGVAARSALSAMVAALGSSLEVQGQAQQTAAALAGQLDEVFVHFQVGDRISQMLSIVGNDMTRFAAWVAQNPQATASDAEQWLAALEASYTMEEQRSQHHGNVHIQRDTGVEFF
jgi:methyl-accepting chemotaxis protein